jgi:hypothetical protein
MADFAQYWKRRDALFGLAGSLIFVAIPLDSEYTNYFVVPGMSEHWLYWVVLGFGSVCALACLVALVHPPLILAADRHGLDVGVQGVSIAIGSRKWTPTTEATAVRSGRPRRTRAVHVPWEAVRSIDVGEIEFTESDSLRRQKALQVVCDASVDLSRCGMQDLIQTGTAAYFAAKAKSRGSAWFGYKEPEGIDAGENILLIAASLFSKDVNAVCATLRALRTQALSTGKDTTVVRRL